jgi:uncharacterized protein YdgA (DUF945 family)
MRTGSKLITAAAGILVAAAVAFPFFIGAFVQHSYAQVIAFYNSQDNLNIKITSYKRRWHGAHATLLVQTYHLQKPVSFTVEQTIKYGPIIPPHMRHAPWIFGWAAIHSEVSVLPETLKALVPDNLKVSMVQVDDVVTFSGRYQTHFHAGGFKLLMGGDDQIYFGELSGNLNLRPSAHVMKGDVGFASVDFGINTLNITMPKVSVMFKEHQADSGLWVGNSVASAAAITIQDAGGKTLYLTNVKTSGAADEQDKMLSGKKLLSIANLKMDEVEVGPLDLEMSAHDLNSAAVMTLINAYKASLLSADKQHFSQQFLAALPSIFGLTSTLRVDRLKLNTMDGNLAVNAQIAWPRTYVSPPQGLIEIFQNSNANVNMQIAVKLAQELLGLAADLNYIAHRIIYPQQSFFEMQKDRGTLEKQNSFLIAVLIQNNQIKKEVGLQLLDLAKAHASLDDYSTVLKQFQGTHVLSESVVKMLRAQYEKITIADLSPDERMQYLENKFAVEFEQWLKLGYVTQDKDNYNIAFDYQKGAVKVNGKALMP